VDELQLQKGWRERWGKTPLMSVLWVGERREEEGGFCVA